MTPPNPHGRGRVPVAAGRHGPALRLAGAIGSWTRDVGWRVDGWVALAALDRLWRPPTGPIYLDGPTRPDAADLTDARARLRHLAAGGWSLQLTTSTPTHSTGALARDDTAVALNLRRHPAVLPAVQAPPPTIASLPPPAEMAARRAYLVAATPPTSRCWRHALIDLAALWSVIPVRQQPLLSDHLPAWITALVHARLTSDHADQALDRLPTGVAAACRDALGDLHARWHSQ